jgi:uncharacterized delta-60 repeat protein
MRVRPASGICGSVLLASLAVVVTASAAGGDLDPSFDGDGKAVLAFEDLGLRDLATAGDDAIVVAGTVTPPSGPRRFGVARLTNDGAPDITFSGDGLATATFTTLEVDATATALDDGRAVVVGDGREDGGPSRFALARFEPDGDADATFGAAGVGRLWTTIDVEGDVDDDHATDVAAPGDGTIVVVGSADGDHRAVVLRYEADGDLDPTFSGNGLAITSRGQGRMRAEAVVIDADGRVVIAGRAGNDLLLARFRADGDPDPTFGSDGVVRIDLGARERALGLAIDARGRLVVAGMRTTGDGAAMLLARVRPGGSLDPRFHVDGWRALRAGARATDVRVQADGRIVVAGSDGGRFVVGRLTATGVSDPTFGGDGIVRTTFACCAAGAAALAPGPGGSTLAGGGGSRALLARYLAA